MECRSPELLHILLHDSETLEICVRSYSMSLKIAAVDRSPTTPYQGWTNLGFFGIFLGFLCFVRFFRLLGFNVHNAEHRYMTHDK